MNEKKLVQKLAEVMKQVKYIAKNGYNEFNRYKYATEADVNEKVREVLAEQNVIMIPNMKSHNVREHTNRKGNTEYIVTAEVEFTFMDGDSGETISFTVFGEGQDAGDKATYKAVTGAQKYALMKAFMIPTGDDPESDTGVDERNQEQEQKTLSDAQVKRVFSIGKQNGISAAQIKQVLMKDYQKTKVEYLTKQEYDELCARMESVKNESKGA